MAHGLFKQGSHASVTESAALPETPLMLLLIWYLRHTKERRRVSASNFHEIKPSRDRQGAVALVFEQRRGRTYRSCAACAVSRHSRGCGPVSRLERVNLGMCSKPRLARFVIGCLSFTLPAFAQLDSSALRAKFGPPLNRETFYMPSGFDLIVDYGADNQVCRLVVPARMPAGETMDDFLADLVPSSMRGKELQRLSAQMGLMSMTSVEYEHITMVEVNHPNDSFRATITIQFNKESCKAP